ncbi:hypothetical protein G6F56_007035 [Rhizopus delemar]|uniref:Phosphatase activator n=1 Tax=Rhizopus stolonifer TaxID=4846 RepID=A0A367KMM2_RHIST|nr:hypothetical protein G6F56_007035 [Rhizopus delemar]RCI03427.1 hypothetical protein CU098_011344 [Rhizopus stolonifer]
MSSESPIVQTSESSVNNTLNDQDLIYQAPEQPTQDEFDEFDNHNAIPQKLKLDLRGTRIDLDRETLVNLPESLLIAMFPNGLVLARPHYDDEDDDDFSSHSAGVDDQVTWVDFDPTCLNFVLEFYAYAAQVRDKNQQDVDFQSLLSSAAAASPVYYTLLTKQPMIVLREELEYFCLPTKKNQEVKHLKLASGRYLQKHQLIFDALQKNISRENNVAEQHLIDMLCDAGFKRDDRWGHREIEPARTTIVSMSLVLLKTIGPDNHMATAQKLFLFWRKPARKCWWEGSSIELEGESVRLWARRTWTLELALV